MVDAQTHGETLEFLMRVAPTDHANAALTAYRRIEHVFDGAFGAALNPWRHLGALGFLLFWVLALTGAYLYAALDTSVEGVHRSIGWLTHEQWYLGGVLRSLHRYAADAFVVVTLLHLLREWVLGRYSGFRHFSWLTGIPLLWFLYISGVVGIWLRWDELAQFSATATAEWLDWLPIFATPLTRNFLSAGAVSDRLFSLFVFVHLGVPLLLIFGLWFHIQRISHAEILPPRALSAGSLLALLGLSLALPVASAAAADLSRVPGPLALDWFYLFWQPLMYGTSAGAVWAVVAVATLLLLLLPALPQRPAAPVAAVHPDQCNGCRRCFADCPYAAIIMVPHPNAIPGRNLAQVNPALCASCGICAGACPTSTPFGRTAELVSGIDMPHRPIRALREELDAGLARVHSTGGIVVFGCAQGADVMQMVGADVAGLSLPCAGNLPPSFVEYALRGGAGGVLVTGCRAGGCAFRLGNRWTKERLAGIREPRLRAIPTGKLVHAAWADRGEEAELATALAELQRAVAGAPSHHPERNPNPVVASKRAKAHG